MNLTNTIANLCECLKEVQPPKEWGVKRYSENFKDLWSNQPELKNNILIVWDSFPEKEEFDNSLVNFERYLTPIDWALAYSRHWFEKNTTSDPQLKIVIVDFHSHNYSHDLDFQRYALLNMIWVEFLLFHC